jgi:hypothetical protein
MNCPGSVALCAQVPKEKESVYAAEGTCAHTVCEKCLLEGNDAVHYVGEKLEGFKVTEEMADAVQVYVDFVREKAEACKADPDVEVQFDLSFIKEGMFGTNDASVFDKTEATLHIFDYKHGRGVAVEAVWNPQLMYYALGALKGIITEYGVGAVKNVVLHVVQPRADHPDGRIRSWMISFDDLNHWAVTVLRPAAYATEDKDAPLVPGEKQCRWCAAKAVCPKLLERNMAIAKTEFQNPILPSPDMLSPEELAKVVQVAAEFGAWADSAKAYAQQQAELGVKIPHHKLVRKRAYRKWKDEDEAKKALHATFGEAIYADRKMLSIAQMEKMIKKITGQKADIAHLTVKPEGDVILVDESDKREAVLSQTQDHMLDFLDVFN